MYVCTYIDGTSKLDLATGTEETFIGGSNLLTVGNINHNYLQGTYVLK